MDYMDFIRPLTAVLFFVTAKNISDLKIPKIKFLIWMLLSYILAGIALFISNVLSSIILFAAITLMIYSSGVTLISSINTSMFTMMIMIITESASAVICNRVYSEINFCELVDTDYKLFSLLLLVNALLSLAVSLCIKYILHKRIKIKLSRKINKKTVSLFFTSAILVFALIYFIAVMEKAFEHELILVIYFILFSFLIIFTYFVFSTAEKETKLEMSKSELRQLEEYTANIEEVYNEIRGIKHDYFNVISSISGYIEEDDIRGLKKYLSDSIVPFASRLESSDNSLGELSMIKEPSLTCLIAVTVIYAQQNNIEVKVDIKEEIRINGIKIIDLNRAVGILLDNAFEEAHECEKCFVELGIVKRDGVLSIIIINSTTDRAINLNKIFERGFSTKGTGRGMGLSILKGILDKYPNVMIDTFAENGEFRQIIHIDKKHLK